MWFDLLVLPLLIFLARIFDVSLGTLRIIFISRGNKVIAPILGFFEVLIWLIAISRIMGNLSNWMCYFAYAAGFATGNYIGMYLEEKLAMGVRGIRIFTNDKEQEIIEALRKSGFGITVMTGVGSMGHVSYIYSVFLRHDIEQIEDMIQRIDPAAFYVIEDIRAVKNGYFEEHRKYNVLHLSDLLHWRKGI